MKKGCFITIEGGEGAGKSTIIERLVKQLSERGQAVVMTREPGGIAIAEQIRGIVLDRANTAMDARTEALLYAAARRQHLVEKVIPAIEQGKLVICDRFVDSSLAYQGHARQLGIEEVWDINRFAIQELMPDLTIYVDVSPQIGLARIARSDIREVNRLDLESLDFHNKVREGYHLLLAKFPDRMLRIDGERTLEQVYRDVLTAIDDQLAGI